MSEEQEAGQSRRSASAKAAAASRARRIGGRPSAAKQPAAPAEQASPPAADEPSPEAAEQESPAAAEEASPAAAEEASPAAVEEASPAAAERPRPAKAARPSPGRPRPAKPADSKQPTTATDKPAKKATDTSAGKAQPRQGSWLAWLPAAVLSVAALVFAVLIAVHKGGDGKSASPAKQTQQLRERVLAAAKQCVAQANSYDYRTMDASEAKAAQCTTGKYRTDNRTTFEKVLKPKVGKLQATQSVDIDVAGIEDVSEDGKIWKVLLFGQYKVTNTTTGAAGRYDPVAIQATMTQVGSKWLIAALTGV